MTDVCAICGAPIEEDDHLGLGTMLFHSTCPPSCRFCGRAYDVDAHGWDVRGGVVWSDEWGYVPRLEQAACGACTDDAERRDYGAGW